MSSKIVGILKTTILFMSWSILGTWPMILHEILVFHTGQLWESRLQMTGPIGERTELCFFLRLKLRAYTMSMPPGLVPLSSLLSELHFQENISSSWTVTACRSLYLKPLICDRRPTLPDFHWVLRSTAKCHIPFCSTLDSSMIAMLGIPVKAHPIKKWDKR